MKVVNFTIVFRVVSRILFIITVALIACVPLCILYSEDYKPFVYSCLISFTLGLILFFLTGRRKVPISIHRKDAYMIVTLSWLFISIAGCMPYIFSGSIPRFVNALFESVSGFSTTGASILTDVEILPRSILFWRSFTHWIGGIGIIVMVIIIMPSLKIGGHHLFTRESSFQDKTHPRISSVGLRLLFIYVMLTLAEIILLLAGKMPLFDSVCHAFGTIATGGFSTKNSSIINYSPYIQYVVMIFMFLAGTNFLVHYYFIKKEFRKIWENEELKFYILVVTIIGAVVMVSLIVSMHKPFEQALRDSFFQVVSIITCTGFASADYLLWPVFGWLIIFFCMFLGGSFGSTAGGIKMARHLIMTKNIAGIFRKMRYPNAVIAIRLNRKPISSEANSSILTFISVYMMVFFIGSLSLIVQGVDGKTASSSVATCMAGIGPGIGTVGPVSNFAHLPDAAKYILSFLMLVGRLEIYTVFALFTRNFWRI